MDTEHDLARPHHDPARPHREQVEPGTGRPEPHPEPGPGLDMAPRTPEAMQAAQVARDREPEPALRATRVRGVDWVRPTDLMARHGALLAGRGIDFQAELARRARRPVAARLRQFGDRARRLPALSAFGRSQPAQSGPRRSGVGKS